MALAINNIPKQVAKNTSDIAYLKRRVDEGIHGKYYHTIHIYSTTHVLLSFTLLSDRAEKYENITDLLADYEKIPQWTPASGIDYDNSSLILFIYYDGVDLCYVDSDDNETTISTSYNIADTVQSL